MTNSKKILISIGTRPEAIKMASLIRRLDSEPFFDLKICNTGQHDELLNPILKFFGIEPDYNLEVMRADSLIHETYNKITSSITDILTEQKPDLLIVHGDTATTFASSFSAFLQRIEIAHVEAGLRTNNLYSPWPEEANRKLVGALANLHFAPTESAYENLIQEGVPSADIFITGNTVLPSAA